MITPKFEIALRQVTLATTLLCGIIVSAGTGTDGIDQYGRCLVFFQPNDFFDNNKKIIGCQYSIALGVIMIIYSFCLGIVNFLLYKNKKTLNPVISLTTSIFSFIIAVLAFANGINLKIGMDNFKGGQSYYNSFGKNWNTINAVMSVSVVGGILLVLYGAFEIFMNKKKN